MTSNTADSGIRVYATPSGAAASVTTILSTLPNPGLDAWKERVGPEEAERIAREAREIGSFMHNRLEAYVRNVPYEVQDHPGEPTAEQIFQIVRTLGLSQLNEVWGIETALHYEHWYAGRTDLVGVYARKRSIIDYKNSIFLKKEDYVHHYKLQISAYSLAHDWMFESIPGYEPIEQGVILVGIRPNNDYNLPPRMQKFIIDQKELDDLKIEWLEIVEQFHQSG